MYLKIHRSVKTPWHRSSIGVALSGLWAPLTVHYYELKLLKIHRSVKTPWHRSSIGVALSGLWAPLTVHYYELKLDSRGGVCIGRYSLTTLFLTTCSTPSKPSLYENTNRVKNSAAVVFMWSWKYSANLGLSSVEYNKVQGSEQH